MIKDNKIWDNMAKSFHIFSSRSKAHKDKYLEIAKTIIDSNPKNVLDLGCGSGLLESELIRLGYKGQICAVDGSTEMLKIAKSMCGNKVDFKQMDFDNDFNINNKFEIIVVINVLFFLKDKIKFLENIKRILKDSQSFLILVNPKPNKETSNWQFIKSHFSDTTFLEKILISVNELVNMPRYYKMIRGQSHLSRMADRGEITIDDKKDIVKMANNIGLDTKISRDIHAGQNWLFVMRKK